MTQAFYHFATSTTLKLFCLFLSPGVSGKIGTANPRVLSQMFYHYATRAQPWNSIFHHLSSGVSSGIRNSLPFSFFWCQWWDHNLDHRVHSQVFYQYATNSQPRNPFCHFLSPGVSGKIKTSVIGFRVKSSTTMQPEAVFLVMCDSSVNELWVT